MKLSNYAPLKDKTLKRYSFDYLERKVYSRIALNFEESWPFIHGGQNECFY